MTGDPGPMHPLTPGHLRRAKLARERVRDRITTPPRADLARRLVAAAEPPTPPPVLADELHPRFCPMCGGRPDAAGFVAELVERLDEVDRPTLGLLVTGVGGRRRAEEVRRHGDE